jgi:hypothetical protein
MCVAVAGTVGIVLAGPGSSATMPCGDRVLADWYDNGRVERVYRLACYEEAIAAMPTDIRDYTDAAEVIERALQSAARQSAPAPEPAPAAAAGWSPSTLSLVLVMASLAVATAVTWAVLARRRDGTEERPRPPDSGPE